MNYVLGTKMSKVLFVDGFKKTLDVLLDFAGLEGIEAIAASNAEEAFSAIGSDNDIRVIVTGIKFGPVVDYGLSLLQKIKTEYPQKIVIVSSTFDDQKTIDRARLLDADSYVAKSEGAEALFKEIKQYLSMINI